MGKVEIEITPRRFPDIVYGREFEEHIRTIQQVGREKLQRVIDGLREISKKRLQLPSNFGQLVESNLTSLENLYFGALGLSYLLSKRALEGKRFNPLRSSWFNQEMKEMVERGKRIFTPSTLVWMLDGIPILRQRAGLKEIFGADRSGLFGQFDGIVHDVLLSATSLNLGAEFPYTQIIDWIASGLGIRDNFCLPYHPGVYQIFGMENLVRFYPQARDPEDVYVFAEASGTAVNSVAIEAVCAYAEMILGNPKAKVLQVEGTWCGGYGTAKEGTGFGVASQLEKRGGPMWVERVLPLPVAANRKEFLRVLKEKLDKGEVAGLYIEPIVGDAGIIPWDNDLIKEVVDLMKRNNLPIIVDAVQQGTGRSGRGYFGLEHYPELANYPLLVVTTAKSASNGQPFGFVLFPKEVAEAAYPLSMITTNSGNGGLLRAVLVAEFVSDPRIQEIIEKNSQIIDEVAREYGINLRGRRMNRGIPVDSKEKMKLIQWHLYLKYGILVGALPSTVRFQPMLLEYLSTLRNITEAILRGIREVEDTVVLESDSKAITLNSDIVPDEVVKSFNASKDPSGLNR